MAEVIELGNGCRMTRQTFDRAGGEEYLCTVLANNGDAIATSTQDIPKEHAVALSDAYTAGHTRGQQHGERLQRERIRYALGIGNGW